MKYAIVIPDGCADEPQESLEGRTPLQAANTPRPERGNKTPLQAARIPEMDRVARDGMLGLSRNVPARFLPASDVATLSLFGYDPERYYTGRAPLEAVAMRIRLGPLDWALRCNLMTIQDGRLTDFTAEHISSDEGRELIQALNERLGGGGNPIEFHAGVSYRNVMIYRGSASDAPFDNDTKTTPPHDVPDQPAADHLPTGAGSDRLRRWMEAGAAVLRDHPVNQARVAAGKRPANAIWLWGQGQAPSVPLFRDLHGLQGAIISAVDLVRGTGTLAGWTRIDVPGATGYLDTDYAAKGRYAVEAIEDHDLVCVHIEAPDEASHEGRADAKVEALQRIDVDIVGPIRRALESYGAYRLLVSPDHATLLSTRAHDRAPVPWALCGSGISASGLTYDEAAALASNGPKLDQGWRLLGEYVIEHSVRTA